MVRNFNLITTFVLFRNGRTCSAHSVSISCAHRVSSTHHCTSFWPACRPFDHAATFSSSYLSIFLYDFWRWDFRRRTTESSRIPYISLSSLLSSGLGSPILLPWHCGLHAQELARNHAGHQVAPLELKPPHFWHRYCHYCKPRAIQMAVPRFPTVSPSTHSWLFVTPRAPHSSSLFCCSPTRSSFLFLSCTLPQRSTLYLLLSFTAISSFLWPDRFYQLINLIQNFIN